MKGCSKFYAKYVNLGEGGLWCPCCNPYNEAPNKSKPKIRRTARRLRKLELRKRLEMNDY